MHDDLADLPDDVRELIEPEMPATPAMLDAISVAISHRRDEAKAARASSGIESVWKECEESYIGIDDANRSEFQDARWSKPMSMDGPVTTGKAPQDTKHKATAFIGLTARYVDAGAAKVAEILLPIDDKAFKFSETPIPELIKAKDDVTQVVHDGMGNVPLTRPAKPGEVPPPAPTTAATAQPQPTVPATAVVSPAAVGAATAAVPAGGAVLPVGAAGSPPQVPLTVKDLAEENIEIARKKAKMAETRIYDWMVECNHAAEVRKVIFDASRLGVGVLKAPYPKACREIAVTEDADNGVQIEIKESIKPASKWVDPWNCFPDIACGENIHDGDYFFERDYLTARQVRDLKNVPGYIASQIDKVLEEGAEKALANANGDKESADSAARKGRFEVWYYYGSLKRDEMDCINAAAGQKPLGDDDIKPDQQQVYAIVTLINASVVRATINPLDSGAFPYNSVPWRRRAGHWAGIGVAEQARTPQKTLNSAYRAMLNNAGKSAGSQIVINRTLIKPADGNYLITPDKVWYMAGDGTQSVNDVFAIHEIPNVTEPLLKIIELAQQLAEESTSIPLITQGQSGETTPDTLGATQIQDSNANQLLRMIGSQFDDHITEPVVRGYYEWLLLDPDVPDEEKGDFTIDAHGSTALVERAIQDQTIAQMGPLVIQPVYGLDPKKWMKVFLKSKRLDPTDLSYTEEEQAKIDAAPQPVAPPVQVAQINADTQLKLGVMEQQGDAQSIASEEKIEAAANVLEGGRIQNEQHKTAVTATVQLHDMEQRRQLAILEYANRHQISLADAKVELAKTAMTLDTQKQLNAQDNAVDLHKHHNPQRQPERPRDTPPKPKGAAQLPSRSPNGQSMAQT